MFDFMNLKEITDLEYKKIFKLIPKGNVVSIKENDKKNILSGAILLIIGIIIAFLVLVFLNQGLETVSTQFIDKITVFGIKYNYFTSLILPITFELLIIIYFMIKKDSKITSIFTYIMMIVSIIYVIYLILTIFTWVVSCFISVPLALVGMISLIIKLIGNLFIIIGTFNFNDDAAREYENLPSDEKVIDINLELGNVKEDKEKEEIKEEENHSEPVIEYKKQDRTGWTYKYCPRCALKVPIDKEVCDHCGCDLRNV